MIRRMSQVYKPPKHHFLRLMVWPRPYPILQNSRQFMVKGRKSPCTATRDPAGHLTTATRPLDFEQGPSLDVHTHYKLHRHTDPLWSPGHLSCRPHKPFVTASRSLCLEAHRTFQSLFSQQCMMQARQVHKIHSMEHNTPWCLNRRRESNNTASFCTYSKLIHDATSIAAQRLVKHAKRGSNYFSE